MPLSPSTGSVDASEVTNLQEFVVDSMAQALQSTDLSIVYNDLTGIIQLAGNTNNQGLIWESIAAATALVANHGYFVDLSASAGNVELTLPLAPVVGQVISLVYAGATSILKKAIVARNGKLINSVANDLQVYTKDQRLNLIYVSDSLGWLAESARPLEVFQSSVVFTRPTATNVVQSGIINYLGTQLGVAAYLNPFFPSSSPVRPRRIIFAAQSQWSNVTATVLGFADKSTSLTVVNSLAGTSYGDRFFVFFFNSETKIPIQIKLSSIFVQWGSSTGTFIPKVLNVKGAKTLGSNLAFSDIETKIGSTAQSVLTQQDSRIITSPEWTTIGTLSDANIGFSSNYYGSGTNTTTSKFYDLNAASFYPAYMLTSLTPFVHGTVFEGFEIRQLEFYGEVIGS